MAMVIAFVGVVLVCAGALLGFVELAYWLKAGEWLHVSLGRFVGPVPPNDLIGATRVAEWLLDLSLWWVAIVAGVLVIVADLIAVAATTPSKQ